MRVHVLFFASIRERLRLNEMVCDLAEGATIADLWATLCAAHPALEPLGKAVRFAVNQEYVDGAHRLADEDEVAVIPPVSGGASLVSDRC